MRALLWVLTLTFFGVSLVKAEAKTKIHLPTDEQNKNNYEISKELEKIAVDIEKLKHRDTISDLPSPTSHENLTDEQRAALLREVKTSIKNIETKITKLGKSLFPDHVKTLKSKIAFYKKSLEELDEPQKNKP